MELATSLAPCRRTPFAAVRQRQFRLYWLSTLVSDIAQWAQMGIHAWLILELTGSPLFVGLYTLLRFLPKFLLSPVAGVVADRVNRLHMLLVSQAAVTAVTLVMAVLFSAGTGAWGLLALNALLGATYSFDQPARRSLLPNLVDRQNLLGAVSLNNSAFTVAVVAGPVVATVLLGAVGSVGALYAVTALFAVSLILLLLMDPVCQDTDGDSTASIGGHFLEALRYLSSTPHVAGLLLISLFPGLLDRIFVLFLPVLANNTTAMADAGGDMMPLTRGIGAIAGALALAMWGHTAIRGSLVMLVALACAVTSALFIFAPWLALSLVILGAAGFLRAVLSSTTTTMLHTAIPDHLRGRVMAL